MPPPWPVGTVNVTFSGAGLPANVSVVIYSGVQNAKVDLVDSSEILSGSAALGAGASSLVLLGIANLSGTGNAAANTLIRNRGANVLNGSGGNDLIAGAGGRDILTGGAGLGLRRYRRPHRPRNHRRELACGRQQRLRLDRIGGVLGVRGQLHCRWENLAGTASDRTIVEGDINGDKYADFQIEITGLKALTSGDFVL